MAHSEVPHKKVMDCLSHVRLLNLYSISECHEVAALDLTAPDVDLSRSDKFCPVGPPATACYILDEEARPMPPGEAGELYVGGDMLARGYLNLLRGLPRAPCGWRGAATWPGPSGASCV